MKGIIVGNISNSYKIESSGKIYTATARGKFKNQDITPLVGDEVEIEVTDEVKEIAVIEEILPRKNEIKRPKMANIDQIVFIISTKNPKPDLLMLDKQLAYAEMLKIEPIIIINKCDLQDTYEQIRKNYSEVGYKVIVTSAKEKQGIDEVKECLKNKISVFSGNSGVGKSSIINALFGIDKTQEGEISHKNKKGKNTTTDTKLYELEENTYIADTPGFSTFELNEISNNELDMMFIEFRKYIEECKYVGCSHIHENIKECGVQRAVEEGKIARSRYDNYCKIYEDIKSIKRY